MPSSKTSSMTKPLLQNRVLMISLIGSMLFFLAKGIQYSFLDRHIPLMVLAAFLLPLLISLRHQGRPMIWACRAWAIYLILWSVVRLFISAVSNITQTFDEYHLIHQLGFSGVLLSLLMMTLGIMIWRSTRVEVISENVGASASSGLNPD